MRRRRGRLRLHAALAAMALTAATGSVLSMTGASAATGDATGYATQNGGTTGGAGGQTVRATTGTEINEALCNRAGADTPVVIEVEGTINHGNTSDVSGDSCDVTDDVIDLKRVSNVTIVGVGGGAVFDQLGIHIRESSNIIIQNVTVRNVRKSGSPTSNGGDAIGMESGVRNVWADHLTLEASGGEDEGYDGLFDMKNDTRYVTLSYSILRNSGRGGLIGSSESDTSNGYVTFHHNLYRNIDSRTPLLRGGDAHMYANHYVGLVKSGINSRAGARAKVENNYFQDSKDVLGTFYTNERGYWDVGGNIYDNVTWSDEGDENYPAGPDPQSTTTVGIPYPYSPDDAACVPEVVNETAGAGKGLKVSDGTCTPQDPDPTDPPDDGETARFEAESSSATCDGAIESEHAGYSGTGFCNTDNAAGAAAGFTVEAAEAGSATLEVGFANGGSSARGADLVVNGTTVRSVSFEATGSWTTWSTKSLEAPLSSGTNTVRLVATGSAGLPNIDYLDSPTGTPPDDGGGDPPTADALYVAPGGSDGASGSESDPTTLTAAIDRIGPGGTIYLRGGTYHPAQTVHIEPGNDGVQGNRTELFAYPGETPVLDFSAQSEDSSNRGLAIGGDRWHLRGLVVEHAGDNGILLGGNDNIIERVVTRYNRDTGLQLSRYTAGAPSSEWPSNNLVLSSESHDNADSDGEDADGFAPKLTTGPGNVFRNCVAHHNIDDGWDMYTKDDTGPIGAVTVEDSLAYGNGTLSDGTQNSSGDRNGFKLGGEDIAVDHTVVRTIAFDNGKHGFTYNRNPGSMTIENNLSIGNEERNYNFDAGDSTFRNNTSCDGGSNDRIIGDDAGGNQWWSGSDGSRCAPYSGSLDWSFASDGGLTVTIGGTPVDL
ncbi:carbohydrate-binding protein [Streptomyces sp. MAR4 CNX-425]|uniref:pectate lyase family protein n=1 Tax=Streptomyces sp. MAR4 CNX-425 TaxID=3406343 RepID=UPI003B508290